MNRSARLRIVDSLNQKDLSPFQLNYYITDTLFFALSDANSIPWNYKPQSPFMHTPNTWLLNTVEKEYMPQTSGLSGNRVISRSKEDRLEGYL